MQPPAFLDNTEIKSVPKDIRNIKRLPKWINEHTLVGFSILSLCSFLAIIGLHLVAAIMVGIVLLAIHIWHFQLRGIKKDVHDRPRDHKKSH